MLWVKELVLVVLYFVVDCTPTTCICDLECLDLRDLQYALDSSLVKVPPICPGKGQNQVPQPSLSQSLHEKTFTYLFYGIFAHHQKIAYGALV